MSIAYAVWWAHIRGIGNALRMEQKMQTSWAIAIVFDLAGGIWSFNILRSNLLLWQAAGINTLDLRLWTICTVAWLGLGLLAMLTLLQKNFASDEPILLQTFPISPATFFHIFYVIILVEGSGNWMIGSSLIMGIALAGVLGWNALIWVALLLTGGAVCIWFSMLITLFVLRYLWPHIKTVLIIGVFIVLGIALLFALTYLGWIVLPTPILTQLHFSSQPVPVELLAWIFSVFLLAVQLGVFSRWAGKLYLSVFQVTQNRFAAPNKTGNLWAEFVEFVLGRYRTLLGAMLFKGVLNQSRSFLTWLRLIMIGILLVLFPAIKTTLAAFHIAYPVLIIGYASAIGFLFILEVGLNAIGGEGDRFTLYLLTPVKLREVLIVKLILFLVPALIFSLVTSLVLSVILGLTVIQLCLTVLSTGFLVCASSTFLVLGSAWDEDLGLSIEGFMQAILYEELPASPRRLMLFNATIILHAALLLLVAILPLWLAPIILILIDGTILVVLLYSSASYITKLLDKG